METTEMVTTSGLATKNSALTEKENKVLQIAREIYEVWKTGGILMLIDYLVEMFEITPPEAEVLAKHYQPDGPPQELKLETVIQDNLESSDVFRKMGLQLTGYWPKNILAWHVLRSIYGEESFDFLITGTEHSHGKNQIFFPALLCDERGVVQKFGRAALGAVNKDGLPAHIIKKALLFNDQLGSEMGISLAENMLAAKVIFPPAAIVRQMCFAIKAACAGQPIILTAIVCPDYSYEETGDPVVPYRYNFATLNSGIGLVAQQVVRVIPYLVKFFRQFNLEYKVKVYIADFEADDTSVLAKIQVSKDEFIRRCAESLQTLAQALPMIPVQTALFKAEFGEARWVEYKTAALQAMRQGNFGAIRQATGKDPLRQAEFIAQANHSFYCDWYGSRLTQQQALSLVIEQGAEYAAVNRIIQESFPGEPIIQVAGDRPKMQIFNCFWAQIPTICTKRVY